MDKKLRILAIVTIASSYVNSCCFPTRLEAIEGISIGQNHNGTTSTVQALYNISYDILSKKAFISGRTTVDGVVYNELLLQDYADGKQYVVVDGKCTVIPFNEIMMSCIPSDATLVMSTYYGFDANRIDIDMYSFIHDGVQITLSVTKEGCVPVAQHMMSNDGITDASFVGITLGIKDISIFNVPTYCQNVAPDTQSQSQGNKSVSSTVIWRVN